MEPLVGQIILFAGGYAPRGWAFCNGQLLPIAQHKALFSLIGTIYGGDGITNFALPDLRGRVPVHVGAGNGLTPRELGQAFGSETLAEQTTQVTGRIPQLRAAAVDVDSGRDRPSIVQPSLGLNFIIALEGNYPARD